VKITWTGNANDFMIGIITAVDPVGLTITVNAQSISGSSTIVWSPWAFTLLALAPSSSSSSSAASIGSSSMALVSSSSSLPPLPPPNYSGVVASNAVALSLGVTVWNVNMVASFAVNNLVQITWTGDSSDFMVGVITNVDAVGMTLTINALSVHGDTGIVWSPWSITLLAVNVDSSSGLFISNAAGLSLPIITLISLIIAAAAAVAVN